MFHSLKVVRCWLRYPEKAPMILWILIPWAVNKKKYKEIPITANNLYKAVKDLLHPIYKINRLLIIWVLYMSVHSNVCCVLTKPNIVQLKLGSMRLNHLNGRICIRLYYSDHETPVQSLKYEICFQYSDKWGFKKIVSILAFKQSVEKTKNVYENFYKIPHIFV